MHTQTRTQPQSQARIRGEIVDPATAETLRAFVAAIGWRRAGVELRASERTMRAVLAGRAVLHGSAVALRLALTAPGQESTP